MTRRTSTPAPMLTPPELAKRWRVSPDKIRALIASGELVAVNLSMSRGRPRWRIDPLEVERFERGRRAVPASTPTPKPQRRRRRDPGVIEFF